MTKPKKESQRYKGNGKHYWEPVAGSDTRLRVPGGWLYCVVNSVVFVPMPVVVKHKV